MRKKKYVRNDPENSKVIDGGRDAAADTRADSVLQPMEPPHWSGGKV